MFHDTRGRFGGLQLTRAALPRIYVPDVSGASVPSVGVFFPRCLLTNRASDTSVATPFLPRDPERLRVSFVALALASRIAFPREEAAKAAVTTLP